MVAGDGGLGGCGGEVIVVVRGVGAGDDGAAMVTCGLAEGRRSVAGKREEKEREARENMRFRAEMEGCKVKNAQRRFPKKKIRRS
ncbi:hypothetical protein Tco_0806869 [Tanacetum coccineum]